MNIIDWVCPNNCNSFLIFWASVVLRCLEMFWDVLSAFLRIQNRAFRCFPLCKKSCSRSFFWCSPSCTKYWLLMVFVVAPRATNCAFWCFPSCQKSCSRLCSLLQLLGLFQFINLLSHTIACWDVFTMFYSIWMFVMFVQKYFWIWAMCVLLGLQDKVHLE